ncbi:MAG: hypothetical protein HY547_03215 [Elusimicrobia bacterium]|nr:hypothetical protein [Elusimicrobiota bacterium]
MNLAIKFLSVLKSAATFAIRKPKDAAIILLIFLLVLAGWRLSREKTRLHELAAKIEGLPPGTKQIITVYKDRVITKWRDGQTKIVYQNRYLPPEGRAEVAIKDDKAGALPEIFIEDRSFTRRLGGGIVYSNRLLPAIDLKWAYWKRYSTTIGITPEFGNLTLSRHIDDFTPFQNLEILGLSGISWNSRFRFGFGMRTNF